MFGNQDINVKKQMNIYFDFIFKSSDYTLHQIKIYRRCVSRYEYIQYQYDSNFGLSIS